MKNRKAIAFVMTLALVFTYFPPPAFGAIGESGFQDMPQAGHWAQESLQAAVNNELLQGFSEEDGVYIKPSTPLTRAQMATIVNRAFGAKEKAALTGVIDVPEGAWYQEEIQKAIQMGTMKRDQKMRPNDNITRQEAFTVLARAFRATGGTGDDLSGFLDANQVASWATDGMGALVKAGYIQGSGGKLSPTKNITRAEFAVIMNNMAKQYIKTPGTVTEVIPLGNVIVNVPGTTLKDVTVNGDLIIGDGVGEGNVTLDNVVIKGDLIARGGGVNSIIIVGGGVEGKIIISKVDGQIRVSVEGGAEVEVIVVDDGQDDVILEGTIGTVEITAPNTPVVIRNATVDQVTIAPSAIGSNLEVSGTVNNLTVQGQGSTITAQSGGTITNITSQSDGVTITGTGNVGTVIVEGNNTTINTNNTAVTLSTGVTGTIIDGEEQETPTIPVELVTGEEEPAATGGGGGGGETTLALTATTEVLTPTQVAVTIASQEGLTFTFDGDVVSGEALSYADGVFTLTVDDMTVNTNYTLVVSKTGYTSYTKNDVKWLIAYLQLTESVSPTTVTFAYGQAFSDALMDESIGIMGTFGGVSYTSTATIDWTCSTYNATVPGAYEATGELVLPAGWSGTPADVTATAVVSSATVTAVSTLSDISVDYGTTSASALAGVTQVAVTLSGVSTTYLEVVWDGGTPAYDNLSPGAYVFTGTLVTVAGIDNPDNYTASVTVNVGNATITAVSTLDDISVPYGTSSTTALSTVTQVAVTLSGGHTATLAVTWDGGNPSYDAESPNNYTFRGTLTTIAGIDNPDSKIALVDVLVGNATVTAVSVIPEITVAYGTSSTSALAGVTQVAVTLSGIGTMDLAVTWDGGTPAYDATSAGSYLFTGTLTTVSGVDNPLGLTASALVTVIPATVTAVSTLSDINVDYGTTSASALAGVTQVAVTLSGVSTTYLEVVWDGGTPEYDYFSPGAYTFTGTLVTVAGIDNPGNYTASVTVNVENATITAVSALEDILVPYGTASTAALSTVTQVAVTLSGVDSIFLPVTWNGGAPSYDATSPGTYTFTGTLDLSLEPGVENPSNFTASVDVVVGNATVTAVSAIPEITVAYGTSSTTALSGVNQVTVTLSGIGTMDLAVTWDGGTPAYDANVAGSYLFTGTLTTVSGVDNPLGLTASALVTVSPQAADLSGFELMVMPDSPTIEGITFPLVITNAALASGEAISGEAIDVWISNPNGYLGSMNEDTELSFGGTEGDLVLHVQPDFLSGGATVPIFINTPGAHTLTVTVAGVTTSQSIEVVIAESQASIAPTQAAIFTDGGPGYVTVASIVDASGNDRLADFTAGGSLDQFTIALNYQEGEEVIEVAGAVTKEALSATIVFPDPSVLTPGGYTLAIDMNDGNFWDIMILVADGDSGAMPDGLDLYVEFGSLVFYMEITQGVEVLTWGAISDTVDLANSSITISCSEGHVDPIYMTFGGLGARLSEETNTITFDGNPGFGGQATDDFTSPGGLLYGFQVFDHDVITVDLRGEGDAWQITGQAIIPYLDLTPTPVEDGSIDLLIQYMNGDALPTPSSIANNLMDAYGSAFDTAFASKTAIANLEGGDYLYAFMTPYSGAPSIDAISELSITYDGISNRFNVSGTRTEGGTVDAFLSLFFFDGSTGTIEFIVLDVFAEGAGTDIEIEVLVDLPSISDVGNTLILGFFTDMSPASITNTANYLLFEDQEMTRPITITDISYDEDNWVATLTAAGVTVISDGAFLLVGTGSGIYDINGFQMETMGYSKAAGEWSSGPSGGITFYLASAPEVPVTTFNVGDTVLIQIDDMGDFSEEIGSIDVRLISDTDAVGITMTAVEDPADSNMFWAGFQLSDVGSQGTSPYAIHVAEGDAFQAQFGPYIGNGSVESSDTGSQSPDSLFMQVEFGSMILLLDPKDGGAEGQSLSMAAINVDLESSYVEFSSSQTGNDNVLVSFSAIDGDADGEIRLNDNQIYLSGSSLDLDTTGIFAEGELLSQLNEDYDTVYVELVGTSSEGAYTVTSSAVIPSLYLSPSALSGSSLDMQLIINYDFNPTQTTSNVTLSGTIYDPMVTGAALAAMESVTPYAITGDDTTHDRIKAYYISPVVDDGTVLSTLNNIDYFVMSYDAGSDTATLRVDLADPDTGTASAIIHLMLVDTLLGNINKITLEIIKDEGQPIEIGEPGGSDPEWFANISSPGAVASWPMVDGAEGYYLKVYKDYATSADAIVTEVAIASGEFDGTYELGEILVAAFAGDGTYYAGVLVSGGGMDGTFIEPSLDPGNGIAISRHANITGVYISAGSLYWDTPDPNDGIRVDVYLDDVLVTSSGVLTDAGETGYLIVDNLLEGSTTEGAYRLELTAAGSYENGASDYTRLPSLTPEAVTFHNADPTGSVSPYVTTALAGETFEGNAYASGDAIRLYFNEPITFGGLTMEELVLSDGSTWGETAVQNLAFGGDTEIFFTQYGDSFVITLASGASVASGATITVTPGAVSDVLGIENTVPIEFTVGPPDIDLTVATVSSYEEFMAAMNNLDTSGVQTITLDTDIVTDGGVQVTTIVAIDLDGYQLGTGVYITTTAVGQITLTGGGTIVGDLTIDAPNATVVNTVTVTGITQILAVSDSTFRSSGTHGGSIAVLGPARVNLSGNASNAPVTISPSGGTRVILDGDFTNVEMQSPAQLRVAGNISNLSVTASAYGGQIQLMSTSNVTNLLVESEVDLWIEEGATEPAISGDGTVNRIHQVSFDVNDGGLSSSASSLNISQAYWDEDVSTANTFPTDPTAEGYVFEGWFSQNDGGGWQATTATSIGATTTVYASWAAVEIAAPTISSILAGEGLPIETNIGEGDTIAIHFSTNTNWAGLPTGVHAVSKEAIDSLIELGTTRPDVTPSLGADYVGTWELSTKFVIQIIDATGANFAVGDSITIRAEAGLLNAEETSVACNDTAIVGGLFSPTVVSGTVTEAETPVAGITVTAVSSNHSAATQTNGSGEYSLELISGSTYVFDVEHDYYVKTSPSSSVEIPFEATDSQDIVVEATGSISGTIILEDTTTEGAFTIDKVIEAYLQGDGTSEAWTVTRTSLTAGEFFIPYVTTVEDLLYFGSTFTSGQLYIAGTGHTLSTAAGVSLVEDLDGTPYTGGELDAGGGLFIEVPITPNAVIDVGTIKLLFRW